MRKLLVSLLALFALCHLEACETSGDDGATEGDIARCRILCEKQKSCPGADAERNCTTYCISLDSVIIGGHCRVRYELLLDCDETLDDICDQPTECEMELRDYDSCITTYCSDHTEQCAELSGPF